MRLLSMCLVLSVLGCNKIIFSGSIGGRGKPVPPPSPVGSDEELFVLGMATRSPLDILLVIDNSSSMAEVHRGLSDKLDVLLGAVKDSDWQIALTTTDPRDCAQTFSAATPNYAHVFRSAVGNLGTDGTIIEQATRAAILGLQQECSGKEWLRPDSAVAVLLITDEDNFERGPCGNIDKSGLVVEKRIDDSECHVSALHKYLQKIRVPGMTAKVYGLINTQASKNFLTWKDSSGNPIFDHHASVHDKDYNAMLSKISQHIHAVMQSRFVLQKTYPEKSPRIFISSNSGEKMLGNDAYVISGNVLTIKASAIPSDGKSVRVTWTVLK